MNIVGTGIIANNNHEVFLEKLKTAVDRYQGLELVVEVQYSYSGGIYSALVIAREQ
jgi:hypothetical protein